MHAARWEAGTRSLQQICAFCAAAIVRIIIVGGGANQSLPDIALERGSNETPLTSPLNITQCCVLCAMPVVSVLNALPNCTAFQETHGVYRTELSPM